MPQIFACVKSLWEYMHRRQPATCYRLRVRSDTDRDLASWFFLSHTRAGHPRLNLVASAFFDESSLAVELIGQESGFDWIMVVTFIGRLWKRVAADEGRTVDQVFVAQGPVKEGCHEGHRCLLSDDWESTLSEVRVFPPIHTVSKPSASNIRKSYGIPDMTNPGSRQHRATTGRHSFVRPPIPGDAASSDSGVDGPGSEVRAGSDSDSDELPSFVRRVPDQADADGDASARNQRLHAFGPWSISEIWDTENNVQIGWGANCNSHFRTSSSTPCKKPFNTLKSGIGSTLDECRRQAKQWLLEGAGIQISDPDGRTRHVHGIKRTGLVPLQSDRELDERCQAYM